MKMADRILPHSYQMNVEEKKINHWLGMEKKHSCGKQQRAFQAA